MSVRSYLFISESGFKGHRDITAGVRRDEQSAVRSGVMIERFGLLRWTYSSTNNCGHFGASRIP